MVGITFMVDLFTFMISITFMVDLFTFMISITFMVVITMGGTRVTDLM